MPNVPKIVRERIAAVPPVADHPDANVLTAFAEHSLPERERTSVLEHLGRCADCRDVVALALPEAAEAQPAPVPARAGWLTWPALRWGLVAAGIVTIATVGIRLYHRPESAMMARQQAPQLKAPVAESRAASAPPHGTTESATKKEQAVKNDKSTTSALTDLENTNAVYVMPKEMTRSKTAPSPQSRNVERQYSIAAGAPAHSGPAAPAQWPQQNAMNNSQNAFEVTNQAVSPAAAPTQPGAGASLGGVIGAQQESRGARVQAPQVAMPIPNLKGKDSDQAAQAQAQYNALVKAKPPVPSASGAAPGTLDALAGMQKLQAQPGEMGGYVVDPTGAMISNAHVIITPSAGGTASAVTDAQGRWLIAGLPTGTYQARAEAPGFKTTVQALNYDANHPSLYVFPLSLGNAAETVEVSAQNAQIQATEAAVDAAVTSNQPAQLPLNGRNITQLASLVQWTISPAGSLQRSLDQGKTWQDVDVAANVRNAYAVEIVAKNSAADDKAVNRKALKQKSKSALVFRAVAAAGADVWAGGSAGALYHSTDAGNTWTRVVPASASAMLTGDIVSLQFIDSLHGTIMTSTSEVWTTSDDGRTWQKQ